MWKWLVTAALVFGTTAESVQAQMRGGRINQPRMPMTGFGNLACPLGGCQGGFQGSMFRPFGNGLGASRFTNMYGMSPYATSPYGMNSYMNPYMMNSYMMNPYMSGNSHMSGNSYGSGYSSMSSDPSGGSAGYGGQGYGGTGYGQSAGGQAASIAASTLFGVPAQAGQLQWPLGLLTLPPAAETKALRQQLDLVLPFVATQAAAGQVNRAFIDEGLEAVRAFRQLLRPCEGAMADVTYTDAMRFLDRAERGLMKMKMIETSASRPATSP